MAFKGHHDRVFFWRPFLFWDGMEVFRAGPHCALPLTRIVERGRGYMGVIRAK